MAKMNLKKSWQWDGQSVLTIIKQRSKHDVSKREIQEWKSTIPADIRDPVVMIDKVAGHREENEMVSILAVDVRGQALLRRVDAVNRYGRTYCVLSIDDARSFINQCRKQFVSVKKGSCRRLGRME
jgi:hypothetical protein